MSSQYPTSSDNDFSLLRKITNNTAEIVDAGPGGGGSGGDASAANQLTEIARLDAIRDRLPASASLALTVTIATGAGTVTAGSKQVGFAVTGAAAATIAGSSVPSGTSFSVDAPGVTTIGAVTYDATGTTLVITRLA
jgi:hypothetical protein